jgi:putative isomerase
MLLYNRTHDVDLLHQVYDVFTANNDWFYATRDPGGDGLCVWDGTDSGWDTSPRWDNGTVEAVDLNAWLCLDQRMLSEMATALGNSSGAAYWTMRADHTKKRVQDNLWSEKLGVYLDRLPKTKELVETITPVTFWAMLAGIATQEQAQRMVAETLENPAALGTRFPMPCVSRSDSRFDPTNYWRGPVWINLNYLTILALRQYGMHDSANVLKEKTLDLVSRNPVPREYYNPLTGEGLGALNYQWTGALFVVLASEPPQLSIAAI